MKKFGTKCLICGGDDFLPEGDYLRCTECDTKIKESSSNDSSYFDIYNKQLNKKEKTNKSEGILTFLKKHIVEDVKEEDLVKGISIVFDNYDVKFAHLLYNLISKKISKNDLREHLLTILDDLSAKQPEIFNCNKSRDVFIAHSSKDFALAQEVLYSLEQKGISCFIFTRNIMHGSDGPPIYQKELNDAIKSCSLFLFINTENARNSEAFKEIMFLREMDIENFPKAFKGKSYESVSHEYKKKRINLKYGDYGNEKNDLIIKNTFSGFTECLTVEAAINFANKLLVKKSVNKNVNQAQINIMEQKDDEFYKRAEESIEKLFSNKQQESLNFQRDFDTNVQSDRQTVKTINAESIGVYNIQGEDYFNKTGVYGIQADNKKFVFEALTDEKNGTLLKKESQINSKHDKYIKPPFKLLPQASVAIDNKDYTKEAQRLVEILDSFDITCLLENIIKGPAIMRFELKVAMRAKLKNLQIATPNIALALKTNASSIWIQAPIPNRLAIAIEIPREDKQSVNLIEVVESAEFQNAKSPLTFAVGKGMRGNIVGDLRQMPHLLIGGSTGSGKSVAMNSLITSIMYKSSPDDVRFILIDPKRIEFSHFKGMPHLYIKEVIEDPMIAINALSWAIEEMERRYSILTKHRVMNISEYNELSQVKKGELPKICNIVIAIDELADLMIISRRSCEDNIRRLAQKSRAAGIHLVIATQRPSVDVLTGVIKSNFPSRIALKVATPMDSRIILDAGGAEKLNGKGDMLFQTMGEPEPMRVQGTFIDSETIKDIVQYLKQNNTAKFDETAYLKIFESLFDAEEKIDISVEDTAEDVYLIKALKTIVEYNRASVSLLQRRLSIGFNRAAKLIDQLEGAGFISEPRENGAREIYITYDQLKSLFEE